MKKKTTRLVDPQGRVSIPGYLRELAGINPGDTVAVEVDDDCIRIYASEDRCCICGESQSDVNLLTPKIGPHEHKICVPCARIICNTLKK